MAEEEAPPTSLGSREKQDARRRESPSAAVVYEAIRGEAETELSRPLAALAWSALAAGLSMGFSFITQALLYSFSSDLAWQPVISSFGYSVGFLFVNLGRQQLFTENTLTPVLEVLRVRNVATTLGTLKLWLVVLCFNLLGTAIFALVLTYFDVLQPKVDEALALIASREFGHDFGTMFVRAIFAGWLVALMVWLMPFAESARVGVVILVTFVVGLAPFPHVIAGTVAALFGVFHGPYSFFEFLSEFFVPTLLGNMVGGIMLVAAINYAQVSHLRPEQSE